MISCWFFAFTDNGRKEFDFNCKGTEVHVIGSSTPQGWSVSLRVYIFGVTGYGYCGRNLGNGTWNSVLLAILQRVVNEHKSFSGGRKELIEAMRVIWKNQ